MSDQQQQQPTPQPQQRLQTFGEFVAALENGALHQQLTEALKTMAEELENFAMESSGKASGELKLAIKFKLDGGVFEIFADHSVKLPKGKPARTILWATPENFFTTSYPKQIPMFPHEVRNGYGDATNVRNIG